MTHNGTSQLLQRRERLLPRGTVDHMLSALAACSPLTFGFCDFAELGIGTPSDPYKWFDPEQGRHGAGQR